MSNQIELKRQTLAQMLANNRLTKVAGDQEIKHTTPLAQNDLGKEQTEEINKNIEGTIASTPAAENNDKAKVDTPPNCQNLNTPADAALARTGTQVNEMEQNDPLTNCKTAADYRRTLAGILHRIDKKASVEQPEGEFVTGKAVFNKLAALDAKSTDADIADARESIVKLASTNPLFGVCRDRILMRKLAEDIDALAAAEQIPPEEAAQLLDAAAVDDPSMMQAAEAEADGEAVQELAGAEDEADALMGQIQELADGASQATGTEVTPEVMMDALDIIQEEADRLGVPPEAIIQEVLESQGAEAEVTPEDEANADALMEAAAEMGVSPDELMQMAAEELGGGGGDGGEAAPAAPAAAAPEAGAEPSKEEPEEKKEAAANIPMTDRAAYTQQLIHKIIG